MSEQHEAEDLKSAKKGDVVVVVDPNRGPRRAPVESAGPKWITVGGVRYTRDGRSSWSALRTCEQQRSHDLLHEHHDKVCALLRSRAWPRRGWSCAEQIKSADLRPLLERELRVARELAEIWSEVDRLELEARVKR